MSIAPYPMGRSRAPCRSFFGAFVPARDERVEAADRPHAIVMNTNGKSGPFKIGRRRE